MTKTAVLQHKQIEEVQDLHARVKAVLDDSLLSPAFIGLKIVSLENDSVLFDQYGNKLFHPASNLKLLTTSTALHLLDSNYQFRTTIYRDSVFEDGTLSGNLYVKGFGDALFDEFDLDSIVRTLRELGVHTICGDIVGDVSYFDSLSWGSGWMWDDEPDPDEAFISPLTINNNAFQITVRPAEKEGLAPLIEILPFTDSVTIINAGITSSDTSLPPLRVTRAPGNDRIIIQGRISPLEEKKSFGISIRKPEIFFLNLLKERLEKSGIEIFGIVRLEPVHQQIPVMTIQHPLDSIVYHVNKHSNNLAAENLLKCLASEKFTLPGSSVNGITLVKQYLISTGIDTTEMIIADGSGVSWYNAISPDVIVQVLANEYNNKSTFRRFYESLSVSGIDGKLKNQMKGTSAEGKVHAKTGTLTGTSGLSGYVMTADNHLLAFSMLSNHFPGKVSYLREVQNRIMEILAGIRLQQP